MQSSAVSFKFYFQRMTEEGHRFPDTNPEKILQGENEVSDETMEQIFFFFQ